MATPPSATGNKKPIPWSHEETLHLIQAYQDKWYELRRGQLKASQWEEVAVTVAARCGYDYSEPSKSATQCRHKMEKLRQRHRSVKSRLGVTFGSGWPYFDLMERLQQGPMPISARRPQDQEQVDDDDEVEDEDEHNYSKVQSIDYILRRPTIVNRFSGYSKRPRESVEIDDGDVVDDGQRGTEMVVGLAAEIKAFAKRLIGVENMRIKFMKDTERCRLDMENKRIDMILQSQRKILDSIDRAFGSSS